MAVEYRDVKYLFDNSQMEFLLSFVPSSDASSGQTIIWELTDDDGTAVGSGTLSGVGDGTYTFAISKTVAETLNYRGWYTLSIDHTASGRGWRERLRVIHRNEWE